MSSRARGAGFQLGKNLSGSAGSTLTSVRSSMLFCAGALPTSPSSASLSSSATWTWDDSASPGSTAIKHCLAMCWSPFIVITSVQPEGFSKGNLSF